LTENKTAKCIKVFRGFVFVWVDVSSGCEQNTRVMEQFWIVDYHASYAYLDCPPTRRHLVFLTPNEFGDKVIVNRFCYGYPLCGVRVHVRGKMVKGAGNLHFKLASR
jgi:hypothetical protein